MHQKVEQELTQLVEEGTLEPVDYSDWVAPIVAVVKSDQKSVCVCGDFRMTINPVSKLNCYPIVACLLCWKEARHSQNWI